MIVRSICKSVVSSHKHCDLICPPLVCLWHFKWVFWTIDRSLQLFVRVHSSSGLFHRSLFNTADEALLETYLAHTTSWQSSDFTFEALNPLQCKLFQIVLLCSQLCKKKSNSAVFAKCHFKVKKQTFIFIKHNFHFISVGSLHVNCYFLSWF